MSPKDSEFLALVDDIMKRLEYFEDIMGAYYVFGNKKKMKVFRNFPAKQGEAIQEICG